MCFLSLTCNAQQSNLWNTEHYRDRMAEFAKMRSIDASDIVMLGIVSLNLAAIGANVWASNMCVIGELWVIMSMEY